MLSAMQGCSNVLIFDDSEQLARAAAERIVDLGRTAMTNNARYSVALAGGSTPKRVYELLASEPYDQQLDWSRLFVFFGDERCVSADDPQSNYRMAWETMLSKLPIPRTNIHRMIGEEDPRMAAKSYERELREFFAGDTWPRFDLILLGLGEDGHTASLFPETQALSESAAWVSANWVQKLNSFRLTLTLPAINHAKVIMFLVSGDKKAETLKNVLADPQPPVFPAQLVQPVAGTCEWYVDKAAARAIS